VIWVIPVVCLFNGSHVSSGNDGANFPSSSVSSCSSNVSVIPFELPDEVDPGVVSDGLGYRTTSHACQPIRCALPGPRGVASRGRERRMTENTQAMVSGRRESLNRWLSFGIVGLVLLPQVVEEKVVQSRRVDSQREKGKGR